MTAGAMPFADPQALSPPRVTRESRPDGSFVLRSQDPLQPFARCIGDWLEHWAEFAPDAPFLCERDETGSWRRMSYAQVRAQVGRLDRKSTRLNSSHSGESRMPSSA